MNVSGDLDRGLDTRPSEKNILNTNNVLAWSFRRRIVGCERESNLEVFAYDDELNALLRA